MIKQAFAISFIYICTVLGQYMHKTMNYTYIYTHIRLGYDFHDKEHWCVVSWLAFVSFHRVKVFYCLWFCLYQRVINPMLLNVLMYFDVHLLHAGVIWYTKWSSRVSLSFENKFNSNSANDKISQDWVSGMPQFNIKLCWGHFCHSLKHLWLPLDTSAPMKTSNRELHLIA